MDSRLNCIGEWEALARRAGYCATTLAKLAGVTDRHLRRFFLERFDCTPHAFLNTLRLRVAYSALAEGNSIKWAADAAGFRHVSHFSSAFKKSYGICPSCFLSRSDGENGGKCPESITNVRFL